MMLLLVFFMQIYLIRQCLKPENRTMAIVLCFWYAYLKKPQVVLCRQFQQYMRQVIFSLIQKLLATKIVSFIGAGCKGMPALQGAISPVAKELDSPPSDYKYKEALLQF